MKLEISLFRFDAKTDYLPYYTKHYIKIEDEKNLLDILKNIQTKEQIGFCEDLSFGVVVNGLYTTLALSIEEIKLNLGKELKIEPLSTRRVYKDLLINEDDFYSKLHLIKNYTFNNELKEKYESYKLYFYASNTLNINKNYIGDAFILLSKELLLDNNVKDEVIALLKDEKNGIIFHTSLKNRVFNFDNSIEQNIKKIQQELDMTKDISKQNFKSKKSKKINFGEFMIPTNIKYDFKDFTLAYYQGTTTNTTSLDILNLLNAKFLNLASLKYDLALNTYHTNEDFTYKLASKILLDAFDNGADLLIIDTNELFYLFDSVDELQRVSSRDIKLPIIHINELCKLTSGDFSSVKNMLKSHQIDPEII